MSTKRAPAHKDRTTPRLPTVTSYIREKRAELINIQLICMTALQQPLSNENALFNAFTEGFLNHDFVFH